MPPRGSEAYRQGSTGLKDWRYDPRLAEEYAARQDLLNSQRLGQLAEEGQIAAAGAERMGDIASEGIKGVASSYHQGQQRRQDSEAHQRRMELSEEDLADKRAEREWMDSPDAPAAEEGAPPPTHRQQMMQLKGDELKAKIDALKNKGDGKSAMTDYQAAMVKLAQDKEAREGKKPAGGTMNEYQREMLRLAQEKESREKEKSAAALAKPVKSAGEDQLDKEFAKDFNDWESSGKASLGKNMELLSGAKAKLADMVTKKKDPRGIAGRASGRLPDELKSEDAVKIRDDVRAAANGAMRAALGASFTEKEGLRIMDAAYNENLSPEENLKKIDRAIAEIVMKRDAMESRGKHFQTAGGTLRGYAGTPDTAVAGPSVVAPAGGDGTALAAPPPQFQDGAKKNIGGKSYTRINGRWVPDAPGSN